MLAKLSNNKMDEVSQLANQASDPVVSSKVASLLYLIKKYAAIIVPAMAIAAACIIVMALTKPKSNREFLCAITATFVGAIWGPSVLILFFHIDFSTVSAMDQDKVRNLLTVVCGLPGWVIVRACFNWSEVNRTKTIVDLVKQIKELFK